MKLPIIPIVVTTILLTLVIYLFNSTTSALLVLDAPRLNKVVDIEGLETEVAVTPDGEHYAVVSSGDLWLFDPANASTRRITQTPEMEHFPSWSPDGRRLMFSRGEDTFAINRDSPEVELVFKEDATSLSWSSTGRIAFVRNRGLWLADPAGRNERQIVEPDENLENTIRAPRFSPDSVQVAFIKSMSGLRGQVWTVNALTGDANPSIADRSAENPLDVGWMNEGRSLVYLTDRSGSYALWLLDLGENTLTTLTAPLFPIAPSNIAGISVWKDRVILPRYFVDSDITWGDGTPIVQTDDVELEPAVSTDGQAIAYTIAKENKFEIWTAGIKGEDPVYRAIGREARFAPNGYQIVYTHTDLNGNPDLWTLDLRDNSSESVTDADGIDVNPDWSPDGRSIVFSSNIDGRFALWTIAASGGKRVRLNDAGHFPRYSPDGKSILFWNEGALWTMSADGDGVQAARPGVHGPVPGVWTNSGPRYYGDPDISAGRDLWPALDTLKDGRTVIAPVEIRASELWSVELAYKQN